MSRIRRHLPTIVPALLAFALVLASAPIAAASSTISRVEQEEVRLINHFRTTRGLPALRIDRKLTRAATWLAHDMASNHYFAHIDTRGRTTYERLAAFGYPSIGWRGESIAAGNPGARTTFLQWRNSPTHRANLANRRFRSIGIARVQLSGSPYRYYWVADFGSSYTGAPA